MADSCAQYVNADDLKAAKESILHIEHVATSKDANGDHALSVTDSVRGQNYTNATLDGLFSGIGFKPVNGSFEDGGTLVNRWDVLLYETNGSFYQWVGEIPVGGLVVAAGSSPFDSSGALLTGWVDQTDLTLRSQLIKLNTVEVVTVPSQFPTLQQAISYLLSGRINVIGYSAEILIESGHSPASGISLTKEDASCITIKSADAVATLSTAFPTTQNFIEVIAGGKAPKLGCLIDGNSRCNNGYLVDNGSSGFVLPGCGVKNAYGSGLVTRYASYCYAHSTIWTGAARGGGQTSGILAWAASISAELADVSGSMHYGAQSAHGGYLSFRQGKANNCARYGIRATDNGSIDADTAQANDCGLNGVRAFNLGIINFRDGQARNCGSNTDNASGAISAAYASNINCFGADLSGAKYFAILAINSQVTASSANMSGSYRYGVLAQNASNVAAGGADVSGSGGYGIRAVNSTVHCPSVIANNCAAYGVSAVDGSTVNAASAQAKSCGTGGITATNGSTVNANNSDTTGTLAGNCLFSWSGRISALDAKAQAGASPVATDIRVLGGGTISCNSGTVGGLSQAANTVTAAGIIFK